MWSRPPKPRESEIIYWTEMDV